jgi:hypothetical protein
VSKFRPETTARALLELVAPWVIAANERLASPDPDDPRCAKAESFLRLVQRVETVAARSVLRITDADQVIEALAEAANVPQAVLADRTQQIADGEDAALLDGLRFIESLQPPQSCSTYGLPFGDSQEFTSDRGPDLHVCRDPAPVHADLGDCTEVGDAKHDCAERRDWQDTRPRTEAPFWREPDEPETDDIPQRPTRRIAAELHA